MCQNRCATIRVPIVLCTATTTTTLEVNNEYPFDQPTECIGIRSAWHRDFSCRFHSHRQANPLQPVEGNRAGTQHRAWSLGWSDVNWHLCDHCGSGALDRGCSAFHHRSVDRCLWAHL